MKEIIRRIIYWYARNLGALSTLTYRFCKTYVNAYKNFDYFFATNGEAWLLDRLKSDQVECVFDVGANHGEWSSLALAAFPKAKVHAFEIAPPTFRQLETVHGGNDRVSLNAVGLSESEGEFDFDYFPGADAISSLLVGSGIHKLASQKIRVKTITGDTYCNSHGIAHIDFLKMDVEGAEYLVLRGFSSLLEKQGIDVIQFEYGLKCIISKFLLRDYYDLFLERDYVVGKLYPDRVVFKPYEVTDEDFLGPNYVAVSRKRPDIIKLLARN